MLQTTTTPLSSGNLDLLEGEIIAQFRCQPCYLALIKLKLCVPFGIFAFWRRWLVDWSIVASGGFPFKHSGTWKTVMTWLFFWWGGLLRIRQLKSSHLRVNFVELFLCTSIVFFEKLFHFLIILGPSSGIVTKVVKLRKPSNQSEFPPHKYLTISKPSISVRNWRSWWLLVSYR